ncbi:MAG: hypothetical protein HQL76_14580, partial [Magnetococcales bacterium]|nr:hypothetical protein [Magnetococcales bacterium]
MQRRWTCDCDGSALVAFLALLVAALGAVVLPLVDADPGRLVARETTLRRMADAALALRAFSARERRLPCPDVDEPPDGLADDPCHGTAARSEGVVPWRTLGLMPLRDEWGAGLRYVIVVSGSAGIEEVGLRPMAGVRWDGVVVAMVRTRDKSRWLPVIGADHVLPLRTIERKNGSNGMVRPVPNGLEMGQDGVSANHQT